MNGVVGACSQLPNNVIAPMIIGDTMHIAAFMGLAGMFFFMCTRKMGAISSWLPPFLFLFGCITAALVVEYALSIAVLWHPLQRFQGWWGLLSGSIALITFGVAANRRTFVLSKLGVGKSKIFPASVSFEPRMTEPTMTEPNCDDCTKLLKSFDKKGGK